MNPYQAMLEAVAMLKKPEPEEPPNERIPVRDRDVARDIIRRFCEVTAAGEAADFLPTDCMHKRVIAFWKWMATVFPAVRTSRCVLDCTNATVPVLIVYENLPTYPDGTIQVDANEEMASQFWEKFAAFSRHPSPLNRFDVWAWLESRYPAFSDGCCRFVFDSRGVFLVPQPDTEEQKRWKEESRKFAEALSPKEESVSGKDQKEEENAPPPPPTPEISVDMGGEDETSGTLLWKIPSDLLAGSSDLVSEVIRLLDLFLSGKANPAEDYKLEPGKITYLVPLCQGHASLILVKPFGDTPDVTSDVYGTDEVKKRLDHPLGSLLLGLIEFLVGRMNCREKEG
jgi:hypothetical protein